MVLVRAHHELRTAVKAALLYFLILFYLASACLHFLLLLFIRLISPIFVLTFQLPDFTSCVPLKSNSSVSSNLNSLFLVRSQQTNTQVDVPVPAAVLKNEHATASWCAAERSGVFSCLHRVCVAVLFLSSCTSAASSSVQCLLCHRCHNKRFTCCQDHTSFIFLQLNNTLRSEMVDVFGALIVT